MLHEGEHPPISADVTDGYYGIIYNDHRLAVEKACKILKRFKMTREEQVERDVKEIKFSLKLLRSAKKVSYNPDKHKKFETIVKQFVKWMKAS